MGGPKKTKPKLLDQDDTLTWTEDNVLSVLTNMSGEGPLWFFLKYFGWSGQHEKEISQYIEQFLVKHAFYDQTGDVNKQTIRTQAESELINGRFASEITNRLADPSLPWFTINTLCRQPLDATSESASFSYHSAIQRYLSRVQYNHNKGLKKALDKDNADGLVPPPKRTAPGDTTTSGDDSIASRALTSRTVRKKMKSMRVEENPAEPTSSEPPLGSFVLDDYTAYRPASGPAPDPRLRPLDPRLRPLDPRSASYGTHPAAHAGVLPSEAYPVMLFTPAEIAVLGSIRYRLILLTEENDKLSVKQITYGLVAGYGLSRLCLTGLRVAAEMKTSRPCKVGCYDEKSGFQPVELTGDVELAAAIMTLHENNTSRSPLGQTSYVPLLATPNWSSMTDVPLPVRSDLHLARSMVFQTEVDLLYTHGHNAPSPPPRSPSLVASSSTSEYHVDSSESDYQPAGNEESEGGYRPSGNEESEGEEDTSEHGNPEELEVRVAVINPVPNPDQEPASTLPSTLADPNFPWMVRRPAIGHNARPPRAVPTVQHALFGTITKVPYLSTNTETGFIDQDAQPAASDDDVFAAMADKRALYHFDGNDWSRICAFFGFDQSSDNPQCGVWFPGWKKKVPLQAYQFYTVGWIVKEFLKSEDFCIMAHSMGLGKTAMSLGVALVLCNLIEEKSQIVADTATSAIAIDVDPDPVEVPFGDQHMNPQLLVGLGTTPYLNRGVVLFLTLGFILPTFISEARKFISANHGIKLVLNWSSHSAAAKDNQYSGVYMPTDKVKFRDRPSDAELIVAYGSLDNVPNPLTVLEVLRKREDGQAQPWQHRWWVFSTVNTLTREKRFAQRGFNALDGAIDAAYSYVFWDEFHRTRSITSGPWQSVAALEPRPQICFMSGTPFTKLEDMIAPMWAAQHKYFIAFDKDDNEAGKDGDGDVLNNWNPKAVTKGVHCKLKAVPPVPLSAARRKHLRKTNFSTLFPKTRAIDNFNKKHMKSLSGDNADEAPSDMTTAIQLTPELLEEFEIFKTEYCRHTIQYPTELSWKPFEGAEGLPAIDIPPHSTYKLDLAVPAIYEASLMPLWTQAADASLEANKKTSSDSMFRCLFFGKIQRFQVFALIPALPEWTARDKALKSEMGAYNKPDAKSLCNAKPHDTVLWRYMPQVDKMPAMAAIRELVREIRKQVNYLGTFRRKILILGHIPMNVAIIHLYMRWLVEQQDYETLVHDKDIALAATWQSKDQNFDNIDLFKTYPEPEKYVDQPWLLCALMASVGTGLSLNPADALICIDNTWLGDVMRQAMARINRSALVQLAEHTEGFLVRANARFLPIHGLLESRHLSVVQLQSEIRNYTAKALGDTPATAMIV